MVERGGTNKTDMTNSKVGNTMDEIEKVANILYLADLAQYREILCVGPKWHGIDVLTQRKYIILAKAAMKVMEETTENTVIKSKQDATNFINTQLNWTTNKISSTRYGRVQLDRLLDFIYGDKTKVNFGKKSDRDGLWGGQ